MCVPRLRSPICSATAAPPYTAVDLRQRKGSKHSVSLGQNENRNTHIDSQESSNKVSHERPQSKLSSLASKRFFTSSETKNDCLVSLWLTVKPFQVNKGILTLILIVLQTLCIQSVSGLPTLAQERELVQWDQIHSEQGQVGHQYVC